MKVTNSTRITNRANATITFSTSGSMEIYGDNYRSFNIDVELAELPWVTRISVDIENAYGAPRIEKYRRQRRHATRISITTEYKIQQDPNSIRYNYSIPFPVKFKPVFLSTSTSLSVAFALASGISPDLLDAMIEAAVDMLWPDDIIDDELGLAVLTASKASMSVTPLAIARSKAMQSRRQESTP